MLSSLGLQPGLAGWWLAVGQGLWEGLRPRAGAIHWHRLGADRRIIRAGSYRESSVLQAKSHIFG